MTQPFTDTIETAAKAAVAAAVMQPAAAVEDVTIRPIPPKPSLFPEPIREVGHSDPTPAPRAFIPPQAERPMRAPRMPRIEELPMPAQNQLRAKRGVSDAEHPEKRRMTLMQRLAAVGLGRKDEAAEPPAPAQPLVRQQPSFGAPARPASRAQDPVSEYAKKGAPQGLDSLGRQAALQNSPEDDQLEIPAFLRRQAN